MRNRNSGICSEVYRADALQRIGCFLDDVYMRKRIYYSALGYLTPVEFEE